MLAALDPHTLGLAVSIVLFTVAIQAVLFLLTTKSYPGNRRWAMALVLMAFSFLCLLLRGRIPDVVSVVGISYGTFLSMCLFYDGLARFHGRVVRRDTNLLNHGVAILAGAAVLSHFALNETGINVNARILVFHGFQLFIAVRMLALIAQSRHAGPRAPYAIMSAVFIMVASVSLVRLYTTLNAPPITFVLTQDSGVRVLMLINLAMMLFLWFSVMLMTHTRIEQELEEACGKAELDSHTDNLTGLWNRHHFEAEIRREIERATRYGHPASLLLMDIDHFKHVNDRHGHLAGDDILVEVARCAGTSMRSTDLLCRWGGEEFVVLMQGTDDNAVTAADKLRRRIEQHAFPLVGKVTVSIGVAQMRKADDPASWMRRADDALYRAKSRGRNRVEKEATGSAAASPLSLRWVPEFTCGHATIDQQHRLLFDKTNLLLERCGMPDIEEIASLMEDLLKETERHFRYEEGVLRNAGYPRLDAHGAEHARLSGKGRTLLEDFRSGKVPASALSSFAVRELAVGHFAEEDMGYVAFIGEG